MRSANFLTMPPNRRSEAWLVKLHSLVSELYRADPVTEVKRVGPRLPLNVRAHTNLY